MAVFRGNATTALISSSAYSIPSTIQSFVLTNISATNLTVTVKIVGATDTYYIYKGTINAGSFYSTDIPIRLLAYDTIVIQNNTTTQPIYYYFTIQ